MLAILACTSCTDPVPTAERLIPDYQGVETRLLDNDLVEFRVTMTNALSESDVADYADCAAAGYTLIRGWGFARHLRTDVAQDGAVWRGDAAYTISPDLPRGIATIDAEVVANACAEKGIPTV
ncbi:MAG: hypothetical protein HRU30_11055 [Rhodobacteraceae bacterium]|nr:hypothetical protein [Paracoccaceae bacterium]